MTYILILGFGALVLNVGFSWGYSAAMRAVKEAEPQLAAAALKAILGARKRTK